MNSAKQNINIDPVDFAVRISIQCNVGKFTERNSTKAVDKMSKYQLSMILISSISSFKFPKKMCNTESDTNLVRRSKYGKFTIIRN